MHDAYFEPREIAYRINEHHHDRPTLLLIHGLSGSISAWYPYEENLSRSYNLIIPDLRGHGLSKRWPHPRDYTLDEVVEDLYQLVQHTTRDKVIIVAHSFGGIIASELAKRLETSVAGILYLAPSYAVRRSLHMRLLQPLVSLCARIMQVFPISKKVGRVDYRTYHDDPDFDLRRISSDLRNTGLHSYLWLFIELCRYPDTSWEGLARTPVRILQGKRDRFVPYHNNEVLHANLPLSSLRLLPQANHMLVINNAADILEEIHSLSASLVDRSSLA